MKKKLLAIVLSAAMLAVTGCSSSSGSSSTPAPSAEASSETTEGWVPTKDVEIVTHSGVGAGGDLIGRAVIAAATDIVPVNMFMQNKKGSAGSNVWAYVQKGKNDGHTLVVITPTNILWYYNANNGMNINTDLIPVARLQYEPQLLVVKKDSPLADIEEFKKAYAAGEVTIGGEASGGPAWMFSKVAATTLGCDFNYVPYSDGGEALTGLLSGQVDAVFGQLGEVIDQIKAGEIVIVGFASEEREEVFPDAPTFKEAGIDFVFPQWRGLALPGDTPQECVEYWSEALHEVSQTESFQTWLSDSGSLDGWMGYEEFQASTKEQEEFIVELIKQYGSGE